MNTIPDNKSDIHYEDDYSTAPPWDSNTSTIMAIGFTILLLALAIIFWSVIPFALTTVIIAYLLNPFTDMLQRRVTFGKRGWAVLLTFIVILVIIVLIFVMLLPPLIEQSINGIISLWNILVRMFTEPILITPDLPLITETNSGEAISIRQYIDILLRERGFATVNEWIVATSQQLTIDRQTIQQFFSIGGGVTTNLVGSVFSIAGSTFSLAINTLLFLTILATILGGGRNITDTIVDTVPDGYERDAQRLLTDLANVWNSYVRGNFTLGVIMGFAMWLIAIVLGLPNPLFLAFVAFAMEFIPNLGPIIAMVVAGAMALAGGSSTFPQMNHLTVTGIMVVAWFIMQQIESIVLVPRIVGDSLKLHPAVVILSVLWGGSFGGIIGVVIAPPLVASFRIIMHYLYGRLTGRTAFAKREPDDEGTVSRIRRFLDWLEKQRLSRPKKS
jgi:predicted PurR-regulated permease PerM